MSTFKTKVTYNGETHKSNLPSDFEQARSLLSKTFEKLLPTLWILTYQEDGTQQIRSNQDYNRMLSLQPKKLEIVEDLDQTLYTEQEIPGKRKASISLSSGSEDEGKPNVGSAATKKKKESSSSSESESESESDEEEEKPKPHRGSLMRDEPNGQFRMKPVLEPPSLQFKRTPEPFQMNDFLFEREKPSVEKKKKKRSEPSPNIGLQMNPSLMEQMQAFSSKCYSDKGKVKEVRNTALRDLANEGLEGHNLVVQMIRELMMQNDVQNGVVLKRLEKLEDRLDKEKKSKKKLEEKMEKVLQNVSNMKDAILQGSLKTEKNVEGLGKDLENLTKEVKDFLTEMKSMKNEEVETAELEKKQEKQRDKSQPGKGKKEEPKKKGGRKRSSSDSEEDSTSSSQSSSESPRRKGKTGHGRKQTEFTPYPMGGFQNPQASVNQRFDPMRMTRAQWPPQQERQDRSIERYDSSFVSQQPKFGYQEQQYYQNVLPQQQQHYQTVLPQQQQHYQILKQQQQQQQLFQNEQLGSLELIELEQKIENLICLFPRIDRESFRRIVGENPKMSVEAIIEQFKLGQAT